MPHRERTTTPHPAPAPPVRPLDLLYDAVPRLHDLAARGRLAAPLTAAEAVKRVWPGWRLDVHGPLGDGTHAGFILRREETWLAMTVQVTGARARAGRDPETTASPTSTDPGPRWADLEETDRLWRLDEAVRRAVVGAGFEEFLDRLCQRLHGGDPTVPADDLVALATTATHGVAAAPMRFFLLMRHALPRMGRTPATPAPGAPTGSPTSTSTSTGPR